ncbi:MAG: septum formation initiator family protein [Rickettsiella sp.]|nr:septum formation initiator family protein [Rickettsiella sp.]
MKPFIFVLALLFLILQYKLWFQSDGLWRVQRLKQAIVKQNQENLKLSQQNETLVAETKDLKIGKAALEAHARNDLNMIKPNELFYLIVDKDKKNKSN